MNTSVESNFSTNFLQRINEALKADQPERFLDECRSLFASIPYNIFIGDREAYYHSIIYLVLKLSGAVVMPEEATNRGRIDAVVETEKKIYVMEFKLGSESEAMAQIKHRKYYEKYLGCGKEIVLMGVGFEPQKRNIGKVLTETIPA